MDLLEKLTIYRKQFNVETDSGWKKNNFYLSDKIIEKSLYGEKSTVGVFSCYQTKFFVIDIDNHDGKTNIHLLYNQVYNTLGKPSLVCKSPHGLHVYYFLKDYYSSILLNQKIKKILKLKVEVKPTPSCSIRLLNSNNILDPDTLQSTDLESSLHIATEYNVSEFLYLESQEIKIKKDSIDIIFSGETNDALNTLIPQWKSQGFSDEECCNKFISKLDNSYRGECRNFNRLLKRIRCYKVLPTTNIVSDSLKTIAEDNKDLIDSIINYYYKNSKTNEYNKKLRCESIKDIVVGILYAKKDSESIIQNPELLSVYNTKYPFYEHEVKKSNIPLPSNLFKSIRSNYRPIFNYLYSIGFIKRKNGRSYDSIRHSCQYYSIDMKCMNKYTEYAYCKLVNTNELKYSIKLLLTNVFDLHNYIINLINNSELNFVSFLNIKCFNMLHNQLSNIDENYKKQLLFSG